MPDNESSTSTSASTKAAKKTGKKKTHRGPNVRAPLAFPKHTISGCLRIPQAILEQNAGDSCTDKDAAKFAGVGYTGNIGVEISSALKYGLLERPAPKTVRPSELTRRIVRPQRPNDKIDAMREAVLHAPLISDVYKRYRGENLPDLPFLENAARDSFKVPADKVAEFITVFVAVLEEAKLLEDIGGKRRVLDITHTADVETSIATADEHLKKVSKGVSVDAKDTCFVMMPFAPPIGTYYESVYEPAIKKAGISAVRADADIFGTGKIIDQIWSGISAARVLVVELTGRNPNVLYELGLATR